MRMVMDTRVVLVGGGGGAGGLVGHLGPPTNYRINRSRRRKASNNNNNFNLVQLIGIGGHRHNLGLHANSNSNSSANPNSNSKSETETVYEGAYGPWSIEPSDIREVVLYRSGLVVSAASFVAAASTALVPGGGDSFLAHNLDFLLVSGATSLGLALYFIHIYVSQIKLTLQALWALGLLGSFLTYTTFAQPSGQGLVQFVVSNPTALWLVGPLFAALTGLVFKEGLCYGKLEAGFLTFIIPALLLGHLSGIMDDGVKLSLLALWTALFIIFAARKFTQPVKDDIGDKSVFMFNALPDQEKAVLLEKLEQQKF